MFKLPKSHIIKNQTNAKNSIFFTFDDGPCEFTVSILILLKKYNVKATFFVIGHLVDKHPDIINLIKTDGHTIESHSIDHNYMNYFKSDYKIISWVKDSIFDLQKKTGNTHRLYFRPPAGILTPPLLRSTFSENIKLILWSYRFFDSTLKLNRKKIEKYIYYAKSGDIILLHDQQKEKNKASFIDALEFLIQELQRKKFDLSSSL